MADSRFAPLRRAPDRELAGGEILAGAVDVYPARREPLHLSLSRAELLRIMGADVPDAEIEAILDALGFAPLRIGLQRRVAIRLSARHMGMHAALLAPGRDPRS